MSIGNINHGISLNSDRMNSVSKIDTTVKQHTRDNTDSGLKNNNYNHQSLVTPYIAKQGTSNIDSCPQTRPGAARVYGRSDSSESVSCSKNGPQITGINEVDQGAVRVSQADFLKRANQGKTELSDSPELVPIKPNISLATHNSRDDNFGKRALFNDLSYGSVPGNVHLCSNEVIEKLAEKYGVANLIRQISSDLAERDAEVNILRKQHEDRERELKKMLMECDVSIMDVENRLMNLKTTSIHKPDSVIDEMLSEAIETNNSSTSGQKGDINVPDHADQTVSLVKSRKSSRSDLERTKGVRKSSWLSYLWKSSVDCQNNKEFFIEARDANLFSTESSIKYLNEENGKLRGYGTNSCKFAREVPAVEIQSNSDSYYNATPTITNNANWINGDWIPQSIIDHVPHQVQQAVTSHKDGKDGGPVELESIVPPGTQPPTLLQTWNDHYGVNNGYLTDRFGFIYNKHKMSSSAGLGLQTGNEHEDQKLQSQYYYSNRAESNIKEVDYPLDHDFNNKTRLFESDSSSFDSGMTLDSVYGNTEVPTTASSTLANTAKFIQRTSGLSRRVSIKYKHHGLAPSCNSSGDTPSITLHPSNSSMNGVLPQVSNVLVSGHVSSTSDDILEVNKPADILVDEGYSSNNKSDPFHSANDISDSSIHFGVNNEVSNSGDNSVKILLTQLTDIHDKDQRCQRVKWDDFLRKLGNSSIYAGHGKSSRGDKVPEIIVDGELLGISGVGLISSKNRGGKTRWNGYKSLVLQGIPVVYRQKIWNECSGARMLKIPGVYDSLIDENLIRPQDEGEDAINQIDLDLYRTMPGNVFFGGKGPGVQKLRRVLIAYSRHNKEIGYCQGMNVIAAILLLTYSSEEDAFWSLVSLIENILPSGYFNAPLLTSRSDQRVLNVYFAKILPRLYEHLHQIGVDIEAITFDWFLSCFTSTLPAEILFRIWDVFLCLEGEVYLFRIALSLFKIFEKNLLEIDNSAEMYNFMKNLANQSINIELLIRNADGLSQQVKEVDVKRLRQEEIRKLQAEMR